MIPEGLINYFHYTLSENLILQQTNIGKNVLCISYNYLVK